jgi:hypothetical protein
MDTREPRLGIDIGRVIIAGDHYSSGEDTSFFDGGIDNALRTPAVAGSFEAIARLTERFGGRVWLVSKCGEPVEARTRHWLDHHRFFAATGVSADHLRFCRRRPDKAVHCAELAITHFVDDTVEVLDALDGLVPHRYLFGPRPAPAPDALVPVATWPEAEAAITATLPWPGTVHRAVR